MNRHIVLKLCEEGLGGKKITLKMNFKVCQFTN